MYLPYLILREHVIDRLYDQNIGYWQSDRICKASNISPAPTTQNYWLTTAACQNLSLSKPWNAGITLTRNYGL